MIINPDNEVVEKLVAGLDADKARSVEQMPTEADALWVMHRAFRRLCDLGWRDAMYSPKDGTVFDAICAGSTGVFDCHYEGDWPSGGFWALDGGDLWPAEPILFRLKPAIAAPAQGVTGGAEPCPACLGEAEGCGVCNERGEA